MMDVQVKQSRPLLRSRKLWLAVLSPAMLLALWQFNQLPTVETRLWLAEVQLGPVNAVMTGTGQIRPAHTRWLVTPSGGQVDEILALPGSVLKAGTAILQLRNPALANEALIAELGLQEAQAELLNLQASLRAELLQQKQLEQTVANALRKAKLEQDAYQRLASHGVVSTITMERTRIDVADLQQQRVAMQQTISELTQIHQAKLAAQTAKVTLAQRKMDIAEQQLAQLTVKAPADGTLLQLQPELAVGKQLEAGAPLVEISASNQLLAVIKLPTVQSAEISAGMPAEVIWQDKKLNATVSRIDPNAAADMVSVDLLLADNLLTLPTGAPVQAAITTKAGAPRLHVPRTNAMTANSNLLLYRQDPADPALLQQVSVATGDIAGDFVIIKSGLQQGDRVLMERLPIDGTPLKVKLSNNS